MAPNDPAPLHVNARGMKCPWPALRAARALREVSAILIEADDPIAASELEALALAHGWTFAQLGDHCFGMSHPV